MASSIDPQLMKALLASAGVAYFDTAGDPSTMSPELSPFISPGDKEARGVMIQIPCVSDETTSSIGSAVATALASKGVPPTGGYFNNTSTGQIVFFFDQDSARIRTVIGEILHINPAHIPTLDADYPYPQVRSVRGCEGSVASLPKAETSRILG